MIINISHTRRKTDATREKRVNNILTLGGKIRKKNAGRVASDGNMRGEMRRGEATGQETFFSPRLQLFGDSNRNSGDMFPNEGRKDVQEVEGDVYAGDAEI